MLTKIIPSYAYVQYQDDPDIQAFISAFNELAQQYLDAFNALNLPVYTGPLVTDLLLDWVALGLYGFERPSLPAGAEQVTGPYNTLAYNNIVFGQYKIIGPKTYYAATDDIFKRILTWNLYKGDGAVFDIRWLKRRIMRFLDGENGTDPGVNQTYQISVTFGANAQVQINILTGGRVVTGGAIYNRMTFGSVPFSSIQSTFTPFTPSPLKPILQSAIEAGVLTLPFQFNFVVA